MKKPTEKELDRFLSLATKWAKKIGRVGWAIGGTVCDCGSKEFHAHGEVFDRAHNVLLYYHGADRPEETALHEVLHLELAAMSRVVFELQQSGLGEKAREKAYEWYDYYEDGFVEHFTGVLLKMDKEIRSLKRKIKKLEKGGRP